MLAPVFSDRYPHHFLADTIHKSENEHQQFAIFVCVMKLVDVIILSLAVVFIIVGIHQIMTIGFGKAYWAIMLALIFFFIFNLRKKRT